jgi:copper chaperone
MSKTEIKVEGMSCMHCVMAVKKAVTELKGVQKAEVEMGKAVVEYDEGVIKPDAIEDAIKKAGYRVAKK